MVDNFKVGLKIFVLGLLKKDFEFVFYFFSFVEKVELLSFTDFEVLINQFIEKLLELLGACIDRHGINSN